MLTGNELNFRNKGHGTGQTGLPNINAVGGVRKKKWDAVRLSRIGRWEGITVKKRGKKKRKTKETKEERLKTITLS
jgi:hypothetical protein